MSHLGDVPWENIWGEKLMNSIQIKSTYLEKNTVQVNVTKLTVLSTYSWFIDWITFLEVKTNHWQQFSTKNKMANLIAKKNQAKLAEQIYKQTHFSKLEVENLLTIFRKLVPTQKVPVKMDRTIFRTVLHNTFQVGNKIIIVVKSG